MSRVEAINKLRELLAEDDISAMIIPSNDPHFGEYIPDYYKSRAWFSGFTGSAATLVISSERAALWTDSRYFIQAEKELEGSGIELMKLKIEGTPSISRWLQDHLEEDSIVAIEEDLYSYQDYLSLVEELSPLTPTLIEDPFEKVWKDRPSLSFQPIVLMQESIAGESISSKHTRLLDQIESPVPVAYIITSLDEIAWLCNLRGSDVEYNPLFLSYAIVTNEKISLFLKKEMLSSEAKKCLDANNVEVFEYEDFTSALANISKSLVRIFSGNRITAKNYFAAMENVHQHPLFSPVLSDAPNGGVLTNMKSLKNPVELEGFRRAYLEDAKAWKKILSYIEENKDKGITEYDIAQKLIEYRKECPDYRGESFAPIVAYKANGALPHYSATPQTAATISSEGLLLIDTGAQYVYGTTDTTRTIALGRLTSEEVDDYTRVLKGMINLSEAKFPKGTRGSLLDIIARGPIINSGKLYMHGTSHGIGHYLCVHEGPQSVRMEENPTPLALGMVLSNEPAVYVEGKYGIRHENTLIVAPWISNEYAEFYQFETITRVPIDTRAINFDLLTNEEKLWLENYCMLCDTI